VTTPAAARRTARAVVAGLVVLLCALFVLWHAVRFSAPTAALAGVLGVAPWLAVGPGLWRGRHEAVATLLPAPYLGYGLMELLANPGARAWAAAVVLAACALFVALIAALRLSRRSAAAPT
jgi:uncharacterized membrane protein